MIYLYILHNYEYRQSVELCDPLSIYMFLNLIFKCILYYKHFLALILNNLFYSTVLNMVGTLQNHNQFDDGLLSL